MSTNGDHEMADAVAGADIGSAEIEIVEPQRIRVVSIFHLPLRSNLFFALFLSENGDQ